MKKVIFYAMFVSPARTNSSITLVSVINEATVIDEFFEWLKKEKEIKESCLGGTVSIQDPKIISF